MVISDNGKIAMCNFDLSQDRVNSTKRLLNQSDTVMLPNAFNISNFTN